MLLSAGHQSNCNISKEALVNSMVLTETHLALLLAWQEHHDLAMNPRHPHVQGTSQGPDIFFQCVEAGIGWDGS